MTDLLRRTAVDAYVISGTNHADPRPAWLAARDAPFVAFGRPRGEPDATHSWVEVDGAAGPAAIVEHLVAQGHRRIAFVGWPEGSGVGDDRFAGWVRGTAAHRLPTSSADSSLAPSRVRAGRRHSRSRRHGPRRRARTCR